LVAAALAVALAVALIDAVVESALDLVVQCFMDVVYGLSLPWYFGVRWGRRSRCGIDFMREPSDGYVAL
jgi:hypothetical protein